MNNKVEMIDFVTGGSTVNPTIYKAVDSTGKDGDVASAKEYGYITAEIFVRDIMGDEDVDEFLKTKEDR